ncbi:hypothetical protein [Demequina sp. SO4-18]|uniref:hypothetical protein n=1 Tax=Demequina sp. SO4-18 TaxID=3401026 RepID=UPI003B5954DE
MMPTDVSQVRAFSSDLAKAGAVAAPLVRAVVMKGAVNVKAAMREDMQDSLHFRSIARSIDFDVAAERDGFSAEIGPRHGEGEPGNLANIAYFGTSRGGGTVRDPQEALDEEAPKFEKALGDVLEGLI